MTVVYGAFIRQVRESRGMSQQELAALVGTSQPTLSAYEHDRKVPSADTLNRIVAACGYLLTASAGPAEVVCGLPRAGWVPQDQWPSDDEVSRQIDERSHVDRAAAGRRHLALTPEEQAAVNERLLLAGDALNATGGRRG